MTTTTITTRDRLALSWYLTRFSWAMQDYPGRAYRRIREDLRRDTLAAADDVGMRRALADLGHPRVLAERYIAEVGRRLPRWTTGIVAAGVAVLAVAYVVMGYAVGVLDTLRATGAGTLTMHPLGSTVTYTATADQRGVEGTWTWQWLLLYLVVAAVAFVPASRLWRARDRTA